VQVTSAEEVLTLQLPWLDVAAAGMSPLASWKVSVGVDAAFGPALLTVSEYATLPPVCAVAVPVAVTDRSARAVTPICSATALSTGFASDESLAIDACTSNVPEPAGVPVTVNIAVLPTLKISIGQVAVSTATAQVPDEDATVTLVADAGH